MGQEVSSQSRRNLIKRLLKMAPSDGHTISEIYNLIINTHEIKCDRKTIERDIKQNIEGVIQVNENKQGTARYALDQNWHDNFEINISEKNLQVISLAMGLLRQQAPNQLSSLIVDAENALFQHLPKDLQQKFEQFKELQSVQSSLAGKAVLKNDNLLEPILKALRTGYAIEVDYYSKHRDCEERREIGPVFLELFAGTPYLLAQDLRMKEETLKRFKLSRMKNIKILDQRYIGPDKEKCIPYLNSFSGVGGTNNSVMEVIINGDDMFGEYFSEIEIHPSQQLTKIKDNNWELKLSLPLAYYFIRYIAGFGEHIHSMYPSELFFKVKAIWKYGLSKFDDKD